MDNQRYIEDRRAEELCGEDWDIIRIARRVGMCIYAGIHGMRMVRKSRRFIMAGVNRGASIIPCSVEDIASDNGKIYMVHTAIKHNST